MKNQSNPNAPPSKFKQAELSLGLRKQFFDAKFVYSQQQIASSNAIYIQLSKQLPSQIHGFTQQDIQIVHAFACGILQQAAKSLGVPISTLIVAQNIFHFFYARKSFLQQDIRDIIMGCMYLACKSEETLKKSYEITMVFDYLFKTYEGSKKIDPIEIGSIEYEHIKNKTIMKAQLDILFQLGFQIHRLLDIPHRYIGSFLTLFEKHPKYAAICQLAWKNLNEIYFTTACLYYPHNFLAAAAVYMGMRECGAAFPEVPWWALLETFEEAIENIQVMVVSLRENCKKVNFGNVSTRMREVGEAYGLLNTFPVPYYRKIMLQNRGKLRITKQNQQKIEIKTQIAPLNVLNEQMIAERKIVKVKMPQQSINVDEQPKKDQKPNGKQPEAIQKSKIDKKNLFQSISKKLQKHEAVLNKPKQSSSSSSSNQSQEQQMIAELKKKRMIKKDAESQNDDKNK